MADGNRHAGWIATGVDNVFVARVDAGIYDGTMLGLVIAVYAAVLTAELLGDKTLYTVGTLATRHRVAPVLIGAATAAVAKMFVGVWFLSSLLAVLPPGMIPAVSCATFLAMAIAVWRTRPGGPPDETPRHWAYASAVSFAAIFSTEWGDVGQITAAVLAAEHDALFIVWLGASLAMITKLVLAVSVGVGIRRWVPVAVVRVATTALCLAMAILAVVGVEP